MPEKTIEVGSNDDVVIIDKLFGPTVFANLRIRPEVKERAEWVIERQWVANLEWIEWCRIPAQVEPEFAE